MQDDEMYEQRSEAMRRANEGLLAAFGEWLTISKLSDKTVRNHVANIDFYINEFLLYEEPLAPEEGVSRVGEFLGFWFIRKAMWASTSSMKGYGASLKKFYTFMAEINRVAQADLQALKREIKDEMPEWLATLARYDDPEIDVADVWDF